MKLTLASRSQNYIKAYTPNEIQLASRSIVTNCLISHDQVIADWSALDINSLTTEDLEPIFILQPELVLLSTGSKQQFPSAHISAKFLSKSIGFEVMDVGAACRTFNVLLSEDRRVVAAFLLGNADF